MKRKGIISLLVVIGLLVFSLSAAAITGREVMERVEDRETGDTHHALMGMDLIDKDGEVSPRTLEVWEVKYGDPDQDLSKIVMEFREPSSVKDTRFLQVENDGEDDDQWIYLPDLDRVRRISASQGGDSFMGSDFTYDDMQSRELDDYNYELLKEETLDKYDCYVVEAIPKDPDDSEYERTISWVSKKHDIPVKVEMFEKGTDELEKVMTVKQNIEKIDGYWTVFSTTMDNVQTDHSTELYIKQSDGGRYYVEYDKKISEQRFTQRFLKTGK